MNGEEGGAGEVADEEGDFQALLLHAGCSERGRRGPSGGGGGTLCYSAQKVCLVFPYGAQRQSTKAETVRGFSLAGRAQTVCRCSSTSQKFQELDWRY